MTNEPPDGWHWGIGDRDDTSYTYWLYTDEPGWEGIQYWDGAEHHVEFLKVTDVTENGDYMFSYPRHVDTFPSEEAATDYLLTKAAEITEA